jgi:hypothetical protein
MGKVSEKNDERDEGREKDDKAENEVENNGV